MRALPEAGDLVAGYRIERQLGRGGMGVVYLAEQTRLRRRVALKLITPDLAEDEDFRRRFERESQLAASLDHPNVIPVYEAGEADGALFISMRYVEGSDLRKIIHDQGRLDPARTVRLISEVAAALDAAHHRGLIHRDVKPANVLIGSDLTGERAYLTDFGLTKHVSSVSGITNTGQWVGTLDYVAPEQVSGGALDARVDIYSLGCVLFQSLAGQVPYPRDSDVAKIYAHLNDPPPRVSELVSGTSPAFDAVIGRALAKAPSDRFPSAGDLARAAQAALEGERPAAPERSVATGDAAPDTKVRPGGPPPTKRRSVRRPVIVAAASALAVGGIAAVLAVSGVFSAGGGAQRQGNCTIAQDRSKTDLTHASIDFVNNTPRAVTMYWLDYKGNRIRYRKLGAGQSYEQPTYITHAWLAADDSGNCVGYTVADQKFKTYSIRR